MTDQVTIPAIHSAKGLDHACVFLIGPDGLGDWKVEIAQKLVYVAITRARHKLLIPYVKQTDLMRELTAC